MARTAKVSKGFPIENRTKEWTHGKNYKRWVGKLKTMKRRIHSAKKDLCTGKHTICKGNLGIQRRYMPQFTLRRSPFSQNPIRKFRRYIKDTHGVKSYESTRRAVDLKPSQGEISRVRVEGLLEDDVISSMEVPLVISKDDFIVDGHHRWAAFRLKAPKKPMKVIVIDAPVRDVLGMAVNWGASTQEF